MVDCGQCPHLPQTASLQGKARAKEMPKIPKDHEEMDPEKVKVFCDQGIMS